MAVRSFAQFEGGSRGELLAWLGESSTGGCSGLCGSGVSKGGTGGGNCPSPAESAELRAGRVVDRNSRATHSVGGLRTAETGRELVSRRGSEGDRETPLRSPKPR